MELIIGCLFTAVFIVFLYFFCKNATFTIRIEYPEVAPAPELEDPYDEDGESKIDDGEQLTFDAVLKEINDLMLDKEESDG